VGHAPLRKDHLDERLKLIQVWAGQKDPRSFPRERERDGSTHRSACSVENGVFAFQLPVSVPLRYAHVELPFVVVDVYFQDERAVRKDAVFLGQGMV